MNLEPTANFQPRTGPVVLCIMDGYGIAKHSEGNAVANAYTPNFDWLVAHSPGLLLNAHGTAVGMPSADDMGNSEVGHNAIGAGRVYDQGAKLVNEALANGSLGAGATWLELIGHVLEGQTTLHFMGLLSDGNVHSHADHLNAMLGLAAEAGVGTVRIHALLDGRDVGGTSALVYIDALENVLEGHRRAGRDYRIASGGGRMKITMDRYNAQWDMVETGWNVHVHGQGAQFPSAREAVLAYRDQIPAIIDQDLPPFVIAEGGEPVGRIRDGDAVIMTHFRGDRAIEISRAFEDEELPFFDRGVRPDILYAGMMLYDGDLKIPGRFLVDPPYIERTIGEYLARNGVPQYAVSETQKYGHVTYFFNGNRSCKFDEELEEYCEVPSDAVPFDERPWMKAAEITDAAVAAISGGRPRFIRMNYPNGDMVGHTGNYAATVIAIEAVDLCLARLMAAVSDRSGILVVTADHGNADEMFERDASGAVKVEDGRAVRKTCHTLNPVPCRIYDPSGGSDWRLTEAEDLGISSLAATCLNLLGFQAPDDYDPSLIVV